MRFPFFRTSKVTKEEVLAIRRRYNLESEVREAMAFGLSPEEALEEWDLAIEIDN